MASFSTSADERPQVVLFDLFQTLVFFDPAKLRLRTYADGTHRSTVVDLESHLARIDGSLEPETFLDALAVVSTEIADEKRATGREVPSAERFRRALERSLKTPAAKALVEEVAAVLVELHMAALADAVYCPEDRVPMLEGLARRYRVGLVSNFDHAPTAHRLLHLHGLAEHLEVRLISDDFGLCKPSPGIFHAACRALDAAPQACLFVGDSLQADVEGAHEAGLQPVWVGEPGADAGSARAVISDVTELPALLERIEKRS